MRKILLLSAALGLFPVVNAEEATHGFYVGGGLLLCNSGERVDYKEANGYVDIESNAYPTRIGGTLLFGYQRVLDSYPVCLGLELGSDLSPRHEENNFGKMSTHIGRLYDAKATRNGFCPFAAVKVGYISHENTLMTYFKAGVSYVKSHEVYDEFTSDPNAFGIYLPHYSGQIKLTSWMPTIAVGLEKSIAKDVTGRLETEYRFAKSKTKHFKDPGTHVDNGTSLKLTQKGTFNVRALVTYNIKI